MKAIPLFLLCCVGGMACQATAPAPHPEVSPDGIDAHLEHSGTAIQTLVDNWHLAAAEVRSQEYLDALAPDAVFLGTDPGERWDKASFAEYVRHYFEGQGRGWKYVPSRRQIQFSADGRTAWFDERLENAGYGILRGTGVARLDAPGWRIVHYSMTFAIPNQQARAVVELVRAGEAVTPPEEEGSASESP